MTDQCQIHEDKLTSIEEKIDTLIYNLVGDINKPGYITKTDRRISDLESFKGTAVKTLVWVSGVAGTVSAGLVLFILKTLQ